MVQTSSTAQMQTIVKLLGGEDADVDHSQITGGDAAKLLGGMHPPYPSPPPPPPGFGTPG